MSKYEMAVRISQVQNLVEERKYRKAAAVLSTIDVRQVKSQSELQTFAEVYVKTEQFEAAKAIYLRIYKRNRNKKVLYRLIYLAIRTNHLDEAEEFYEEFQDLNHSEQESLILRYRIDKAKGVPFNRLIETLERLKEEDYVEEWAYELAKLYQRAGREEECRRECEDIKLWFGDGEIVERAQALLDYLDEDETIYYEDRDYTVDPPEEPNPEDTGSLPDLGPELMRQEIEKMKKKKREEKRREYIEDADDEDDTARDILYESAKEYVKKEDAYKDMLFSGLTFIIFGIIGEAYLLLCKLDVIPINYNIVVLSGLAIMFLLFLIGGVVSVVKSARIKTEIPVEQEKTRRIKEWMAENLTQEIVQKWENPEVSQAENDLVIMAHIRSDLMKQYPEEDAAYLEMIAEEYFTEHIQTDEDATEE